MVLPYLPDEMLEAIIIAANGTPAELSKLCLVSRRFDEITRPLLWRSIVLHYKQLSPLSIMDAVVSNPALGLLVRKLTVETGWGIAPIGATPTIYRNANFHTPYLHAALCQYYSPACVDFMVQRAPSPPQRSHESTVAFLLMHMPHLEALSFSQCTRNPGRLVFDLLRHSAEYLERMKPMVAAGLPAPRSPLMNLRKLDLTLCVNTGLPEALAAIDKFPRLQEVRIDAGYRRAAPHLDDSLLKESQEKPSLRKLDLDFVAFSEHAVEKILTQFSSLQSLRYRSSISSGDHNVVNFSSIGANLRQLGQNLTELDLSIFCFQSESVDAVLFSGSLGSLHELSSLHTLVLPARLLFGGEEDMRGRTEAATRDYLCSALPPSIRAICLETSTNDLAYDDAVETYSASVKQLLALQEELPELFYVRQHWGRWTRAAHKLPKGWICPPPWPYSRVIAWYRPEVLRQADDLRLDTDAMVNRLTPPVDWEAGLVAEDVAYAELSRELFLERFGGHFAEQYATNFSGWGWRQHRLLHGET